MRTDIILKKDEIRILLEKGTPRAEVCRLLDCKYDTLAKYLKIWGLAHLKNQHRKGIPNLAGRRPLDEQLILGSTVQTSALRKRLVRDGVKENKCESCGQLPVHNGEPLTLQLDHVDGNRHNNLLQNLRILCPNCHSQTETWCKGQRGKKKIKEVELQQACEGNGIPQSLRTIGFVGSSPTMSTCTLCDSEITRKNKSGLCKSCSSKTRPTKIKWPSKDELLLMLHNSNNNYSEIARRLSEANGVKISDNGVRKHLKNKYI